MKIAMVFTVYNRTGGIQRAIVEIAQQLLDGGHTVHMIASDIHDPDPRLGLQHVPMLRPHTPLQMASYCLSSTLALKSWLRHERYDIIHAHGCSTLIADVVTAHSCHRAWVRLSRRTVRPFTRAWLRKRLNPQHPVIQILERAQYQPGRYRQIITVSQGVKRELLTYYPIPTERITVIPNGVNLDEFNPKHRQEGRQVVQAQHGLTSTDFICLFVANEFARKGLNELLGAWSLLPEAQIKLLVVGKGDARPYQPLIRTRNLTNRVIFVPHTREIWRYYAAADCFVFPSAYEAFSLATIEAAASGIPILCTRINGTEELVRDGNNGFFITADAHDIARRVRILYENSILCTQLGAAARKSAQAYSWERVTESTLHVYEQVIAEKAQTRTAKSIERVTGGDR